MPASVNTKLHYAHKLRDLERFIRECAFTFLRFLQTLDYAKRNDAAIVCLCWQEMDWIRRMPTCYHCSTVWEVIHLIFISHLKAVFSINEKLERQGNVEIIWQTIGETGAPAIFSQIGLGGHTCNSWWLIPPGLLHMNNSFKLCKECSVVSELILTL